MTFWSCARFHCYCLQSPLSNQGTELVNISCTFKSSNRICRHDLYEKPNLWAIFKVALCQSLLMILQNFSMFFCWCHLWKKELNAHSLQLKFAHIWTEKIKWLFFLVFYLEILLFPFKYINLCKVSVNVTNQ